MGRSSRSWQGEADSRQRHPSSRAGQQRIIKIRRHTPSRLPSLVNAAPGSTIKSISPHAVPGIPTGFAYAPAARHQFPVMAYTVKTQPSPLMHQREVPFPVRSKSSRESKSTSPGLAAKTATRRKFFSRTRDDTRRQMERDMASGRRHPIRPPFHVSCGALPVWQPPDRLRFRIGMLFLPFQQTF